MFLGGGTKIPYLWVLFTFQTFRVQCRHSFITLRHKRICTLILTSDFGTNKDMGAIREVPTILGTSSPLEPGTVAVDSK